MCSPALHVSGRRLGGLGGEGWLRGDVCYLVVRIQGVNLFL